MPSNPARLVSAELSEIVREPEIVVLSDVELVCHIISIVNHWLGHPPHPVSHGSPQYPLFSLSESSRAGPEASTLYSSGIIYSGTPAAGPRPICVAVLDQFVGWAPSMASAQIT